MTMRLRSAGDIPRGLIAAKTNVVRRQHVIALPSGVPFKTCVSADEALRASRMTDFRPVAF